jgi:hypothetical protein
MITITAAFVGWAVAKTDDGTKQPLLLVAALIPIFFWVSEFVIRVGYTSRYVHRYRMIRTAVNETNGEGWMALPVYDVSSSIRGRPSVWRRVLDVFKNPEPLLFYGLFVLIVFLTSRFA